MADDLTDRLNAALEDRYRVEHKLGEGGMATVYLAEDRKHERQVALKVLRPELAAVIGAERFLAEIKTTAKLQHPNILPLHDSGEADGFLFYVMPYVEGESLRDRLERDRQLPVEEAVRIASEVAEALEYAHEHGVIHRDVKPENILLHAGRPLVADFGIALAVNVGGGHRMTETGLSLGTPHYMSPEQATGDAHVGPGTDVYALGCVLYEMLVGDPPYIGSTPQMILGKIISGGPASATEARSAVPSNVDAVIRKALEKLPADRFRSAADCGTALADPGFRYGVKAGLGTPPPRWLSRAAVAGWVAALVLGAGWMMSARETEAPPEVRRFSLTYPEETGPSEWLALTPDGSALIMADRSRGSSTATRPFSLEVHRFVDLSSVLIPGSTNGFDPVVSPGGDLVAFGGFESVSVAALDGSEAEVVAEEGGFGLRWGEDGNLYYSSIATRGIARVPSSGGSVEPVLEPGEDELLAYYQPVGDSGRGLFAATALDESWTRIEGVDLDTRERTVITEGVRPFLLGDILVFARGESVYAGRMDLGALQIVDGPVRVVEFVGSTGTDAMFTLSSSGDLAYWTGGELLEPVRELIWVGRDGADSPVDSGWLEQFVSVAISPDGTRAALAVSEAEDADFWLDTEVWVKDLDDGPERRLTNYRGVNYRPVWAPDGASVAFITDRDGMFAVYTVPVDGIGAPQLLLHHPDRDIDEVFWSSDGDWLVYRTGQSDGDRDIYARRLRPDTATIVVSALPDVDEMAPALSPNGRWLAYVSNEAGEREVWVRAFPDVGLGSRRVSRGGQAVEPVWSADGTELFFTTGEGRVALEITDTQSFVTGEMRVLHEREAGYFMHQYNRMYAYDGRGDRFLMIREATREADPSQLILVQNFLEEVKAGLGN
jgi:serine/threonine-protein kinase